MVLSVQLSLVSFRLPALLGSTQNSGSSGATSSYKMAGPLGLTIFCSISMYSFSTSSATSWGEQAPIAHQWSTIIFFMSKNRVRSIPLWYPVNRGAHHLSWCSYPDPTLVPVSDSTCEDTPDVATSVECEPLRLPFVSSV
ncbi:hypothetical protein FKM82_024793 [Ascaphus truei]